MKSRVLKKIRSEDLNKIRPFIQQKPVPLGAMAKALGLEVKVSALDAGKSGSIEPTDSGYRIKINRYESRERQRFTLAHEISHYLLHRDFIDGEGGIFDNVLYRSGQPEQVEYEANRLAAALLLPKQVDDDIEDYRRRGLLSDVAIDKLAEEWQVSRAAMEIRLEPEYVGQGHAA